MGWIRILVNKSILYTIILNMCFLNFVYVKLRAEVLVEQ